MEFRRVETPHLSSTSLLVIADVSYSSATNLSATKMWDPRQYTVGWICGTLTAQAAAEILLDKEHENLDPEYLDPASAGNTFPYALGQMSGHNVVIAHNMDGKYGLGSVTAFAMCMIKSFPNIKLWLSVGIGGGAPTAEHDIRLGDIVVSDFYGEISGVYQHDRSKTIQVQRTQRLGALHEPPTVVRAAVNDLKSVYARNGHQIEANITAALGRRLRSIYGRPRQEADRLYKPEIVHPQSNESSCDLVCGTQTADLVLRSERGKSENNPAIHYGIIASVDVPMEDAAMRDTIAKENEVLCFDTEAAGLTNHFPCLIVRGICDYSDSHKNKEWHGYAVMTAAAYTKDLLKYIVPSTVEQAEIISEACQTEESRRIFEWLSAPEPSTNHTEALEQHHEGTGLWFIHGDAFKEWKGEPGSFLWLHGRPGCGKTVLTSTIIEHLRVEMPSQVLLYFYFDSTNTHKQSLDSMLRSLVEQLCKERTEALQHLDHMWVSHGEGKSRPSTESLQNALQSMLSEVGNISIVLDALDESTTRHELLVWLETLVGSMATNCRLLVTSRREPEIETALQSWTRAQDMMPIQASEDMIAYIRDWIHNGDELERWRSRPEVLEEIEHNLVMKSNGM
jgi:nucleoside phosphorylase